MNLTRNEIRVILRGLSKEREILKTEIESDPDWHNRLFEAPDYIELIVLQEKLIAQLDKMSY